MGDLTKVVLRELDGEGNVQVVATAALVDGKVVLDVTDDELRKELEVVEAFGDERTPDDGEAYLEHLLRAFRGTYMWAAKE